MSSRTDSIFRNTGPRLGSIPGHLRPNSDEPASCAPWRSKWGAIASDTQGVFGIVADERNERSAKKAAVAACTDRGGSDCKAIFTYRDQCAVVVGGSNNGSIAQRAATTEQAESLAMGKCKAAGSNGCWVYYSGCSVPVRIR